MATLCYFEETISDQKDNTTLEVEFGRSSFYSGCDLGNGKNGEDSIYLNVNGTGVIMDVKTAKDFVEAAVGVGRYLGLIE